MDETFIGKRKFTFTDNFPKIRWIYGMHCRNTKISLLYFVKDKNSITIHPHLKRHVEPGSIVFSDMHSLYVNI